MCKHVCHSARELLAGALVAAGGAILICLGMHEPVQCVSQWHPADGSCSNGREGLALRNKCLQFEMTLSAIVEVSGGRARRGQTSFAGGLNCESAGSALMRGARQQGSGAACEVAELSQRITGTVDV